jgi:hypothetical protein
MRSLIAGATAGAIEIAITYPAEFAKTKSQLNRRLGAGEKLPWPKFGREWYAGCTTAVVGNSVKAGVRTYSHSSHRGDGRHKAMRMHIGGEGGRSSRRQGQKCEDNPKTGRLTPSNRLPSVRRIQGYISRRGGEVDGATNGVSGIWSGSHRELARGYAV